MPQQISGNQTTRNGASAVERRGVLRGRLLRRRWSAAGLAAGGFATVALVLVLGLGGASAAAVAVVTVALIALVDSLTSRV